MRNTAAKSDIVIAVVGERYVGKSPFIRDATRDQYQNSSTAKVVPYKYTHPRTGRSVVLLDTWCEEPQLAGDIVRRGRYDRLSGVFILVNFRQYNRKFYRDLIENLSYLCSHENMVIVDAPPKDQPIDITLSDGFVKSVMNDLGLSAGTMAQWNRTSDSACRLMDLFIASRVESTT